MKSNKIVKSENMPSAILDVYEDESGRVTFFNDENHWHEEIFLTKDTPLMVSNGLCLLVMGYELIKESNVFKRRLR